MSVLFREKTATDEVRSALIGSQPMSDDDDKKLAELIQAIADGNPVDLKELANLSTGDDRGRLLHDLQIIAGVANVHRSQIEESENVPDEDTKPVVVNQNWGKFLLEKKLGEGTYGQVYLARDTFLTHTVALKLLKPLRIDRSRLLHEARTLVKVRHPNVVAVHGAEVHNGVAGFWMDFIQGQTLAEVIVREGLRSAPEAAILGQEMCKALAAVHATGIVHRDIKPQNVMRETGGRVVLMDFGAVEIMERTGESDTPRMGTPLYLAPELFTPGVSATPQSDIYALGVLLFYLVTGSYPVQGTGIDDLVTSHSLGRRRHLADLRPDLPDSFVRVIETALARNPHLRFPTAGTMRAALEAVVVPSSPLPLPPPAPAPVSSEIHVQIPRWMLRLMVVPVAITGLGLINTAAFNITFGRSGGFGSESPFDWFVWGAKSLVAPVVYSLMTVAVVTGIVALGRVLCRIVPAVGSATSRLCEKVETFARARKLDDPTLLLQLVTGAGALAIGLLAWSYWPQYTAFSTYIDDAPVEWLALLQPDNGLVYDRSARLLEQVLVVYCFALYAVNRIASRSNVHMHRGLRGCAVALPVLALVLLRELPYRTVYHNDVFERVDIGETRCYEIGTRPGERLLHCPDIAPPRNQVVSSTDPRVRPRGIVESVFTPRDKSRVIE
ncbi:MAG TPA: serine/threonine-protein kinase [Vicinamibacterales bacterium]|nr:serine/threonine-protein kinase [Vicinamibacterales bacterium]